MADQDPPPSLAFHPSARRIVRFGAFRMDLTDGTLWRNGEEIRLPPRALALLVYLVERAGRVVSKQALMDAAWKDAHVSETSLTEAIGVVRQLLGDDPQQPQFIQTVHRRGYRFVAPIAIDGADAAQSRPFDVAQGRPAIAPAALPGFASPPVERALRSSRVWIAAGVATLVVLTGALAWLRPWRLGDARVTRASITLPAEQAPAPGLNAHPVVALSPDGQRIVYTAGSSGAYQLYLRRMDQFEATPIPGTRGGHGPFFSPNGGSVAFFQDGALKRVAIDGGELTTITAAKIGFGGVWLDDGTIVFAPEATGGLMRVSDRGGMPVALPQPTLACGYRWPSAVGDGDTVIATRWPSSLLSAAVVAISLKRGTETVIAERATFGRYVPTGHVVFLRQGELHAVPFSPGSAAGPARPVLAGVMTGATGAGQFGFSPAGTLLYLPDSPDRNRRVLSMVDARGRVTDLQTPGRAFQNVAMCGERFAATIAERGMSDIWIGRLDRAGLSRLTSDGLNIEPSWMPDCRTLTFASSRTGVMNIYMKPVDDVGEERRLLEGQHTLAPAAWTPDGQRLVHVEIGPERRSDIWILETATGRRRPLVSTRANESWPRLSPDGARLAYQSDESGRSEIYLGSLDGAGRVQVSSEGGMFPAWSPDGRDLYYLDERAIMRVAVAGTADGSPSDPEQVFADPDLVAFRPTVRGLLILRRTAEHLPLTRLNLVVNWFSELNGAR
jgi:DNA-binding winged helix-turn-helix (wHTH) protein/Tol biopolymer transport system component